MKIINALAHPFIIFVLCIPLIKVADFFPQIVLFAVFACWAMYFFLGANWKSGLWGALCFLIGEVCAVFIIMQFLATPHLGSWALMLAVGFWAAVMVLVAEQIKLIGMVPAYFQAAALYFATYFFWWPTQTFTVAGDYLTPLLYLTLSMAFGFFMGWLTIVVYGWWGKYAVSVAD